MNKKLVAVAIAGLLAAPLAQAQTANVTLYGRANLSMVFVNGEKPDDTNPNVYRVDSNSSRFGLRGIESLGGGLNAIFQIENGSINMARTGGATSAAATRYVGLSGAWGRFYMGHYSAPYDDITGIGAANTANYRDSHAGQPVGARYAEQCERRLRQPAGELDSLRLAELVRDS